jgi:DnaK suppressor protein
LARAPLGYGVRVEKEQATQLLAAEREKLEAEIAALEREGPEEGDERQEPGDFNSEGLYQDELDAGRAQNLKDRMAALQRAEARLAEGTYGLSTRSGEPIPDARLEANPTAELTVAEQDPSTR